MPMHDTIETLHPDPGQAGVRLKAKRYRQVRAALLKVIPDWPPGVEIDKLPDVVRPLLSTVRFRDLSLEEFVHAVRLDLEARGVLERITDKFFTEVVRSWAYRDDAVAPKGTD